MQQHALFAVLASMTTCLYCFRNYTCCLFLNASNTDWLYVCRGVIYTDSVTSPFTTIYIVYSSTHSLGGHGDKQKKVLKGPISFTDSDQIWHTPRREWDASTLRFSRSQNSHFRQNFRNSYLENGPRFFRHIFAIYRPSAYPQNEILKSGVGPQIWAWGRVEFFDRPPRPAPWRRNCTM